MYKELLSAVAIVLTFAAFFPYIHSILHGYTKPHIFSWIIWGITTFIVFLAQLSGDGGAGAWPIGISGIITLYVAWLAYKHHSDTLITQSDWIFLIAALSSIPIWYVTSDPLWAVVILTITDIIGFAPTFRKAYIAPHEEQLTFFAIMTIRNLLSVTALEHYSMITMLFPAVVAAACIIFISMVLIRRVQIVKVC